MIPLKLTLKGIYSYQKEQVIDFSPLAKAKLFGIFGNTGSGKSSILEAITFVLYGKLERLNKSDRINYSLMNLKSKEMAIDFIFKAGENNGSEYRFLLEGKRKKEFTEVELKIRRFVKKDDEWLPVEVSAKDIIGLDYDNFKRTIIIPQGKFQDFLQLTPANRTKMLKEIFELHRYDLYAKANVLHKRDELKMTETLTRLSDLEEISSERLEERAEALKVNIEEIGELEESAVKVEKVIAAFDRLKGLFDKLKSHEERFESLKLEEKGFRKRESFLKSYESCYYDFFSLLEKRDELARSVATESNKVESQRVSLERLEGEYGVVKERFATLKTAFDKLEALRSEVVECERALKVRELESSIGDEEALFDKIIKGLATIQGRIEGDQASLELLKTEIKGLRGSMPDLKRLSRAKEYFSRKAVLQEGVDNCLTELAGVEKELHALKEVKTAPIAAANGLSGPLKVEQLLGILQKRQEDSRGLEAALMKRHSELMVKEQLEKFAHNLEEGENCPLCGSKEHPEPVNYLNLKDELLELSREREGLEETVRNLTDDLLTLEKIGESLIIYEKRAGELEVKRQESSRRLDVFIKENGDFEKEFSELSEIEKAFNSSIEIENRIKAKESDFEELEEHIKAQKARCENGESKRNSVENRLAGLKRLHEDYLGQLSDRACMDWGLESLRNRIAELKEYIPGVERDYRECEARLKEKEQQKIGLESELKTVTGYLQELNERLQELSEELESRVEKSGYASLAEVETILAAEIDLNREKEAISSFFQDYETVSRTINELKGDCEGVEYDSEGHSEALKRLEELKRELGGKREENGRLKTIIEDETRRLEQKKDLELIKERQESRLNDIKLLRNLFKGNGFVNYISTIYLNNLCNAANQRFYKLTNKNLKLRINENNDFEVIDYLNEGKTRSIKTLSGGQLFQAALSLALSLSDNFQNLKNLDQHFFFLDEGFGALDSETLQIVFKTLQSLYKENRMVGVISHVDELKNNIDYFISVERDPQEGSLIRYSWD